MARQRDLSYCSNANGWPLSVGLVVVTPIADVESVGARRGKRAGGTHIELKPPLAQIEAR